MSKVIKWGVIAILAIGVALGLALKFSKTAQNAALDKISDAAVKRIAANPDAVGTVAADFINIPIEAREISEGIWQATGVANTHIIKTNDGDVMFDTGLVTQATKQKKVLETAIPDLDLSHIIISHSHADHSGGTNVWHRDGMEIVAHADFLEEQRYLTELQDYFWYRNKTLFPFMPETPPKIGLLAYGGIQPSMEVANGTPYKFSQGGVDFEVWALPGAEGLDNLVLWLPQKKILFSGDFFGPIFPQFPNVFTMRGEKIRKPIEYINSLEVVLALQPEMIVPSHRNPVIGKDNILKDIVKMRDATRFVHDQTIAGMNAGMTVEQLMSEIQLPPELALTQEHGKVSWAVKSIWEYYATWFHFDKTTELYPVPANSIYADLVELSGSDLIVNKASAYAMTDPLKALHLVDIVLETDQLNKGALKVRKAALSELLTAAEAGDKNSYEIYWLNYRLRDTNQKLSSPQ